MGMSLFLNSIKDSDIESLIQNPILIEILECEEINTFHINTELKYGIKYEDVPRYSNWRPKEKVETLNIEGAFISLDYLLTGRGEIRCYFPFNFLTTNYRVITNMFAGPVNAFYAREVLEIARALQGIDQSVLIKEYDVSHYNEKKVYPRGYIWKEEDVDEMLEQLKSIIGFLMNASNDNKGIYTVIS